jgi:hypothetical protein
MADEDPRATGEEASSEQASAAQPLLDAARHLHAYDTQHERLDDWHSSDLLSDALGVYVEGKELRGGFRQRTGIRWRVVQVAQEAAEEAAQAAARRAVSEQGGHVTIDAVRQSELLERARAVRAQQKATEGTDADPLVRARRSAARLRDLRV